MVCKYPESCFAAFGMMLRVTLPGIGPHISAFDQCHRTNGGQSPNAVKALTFQGDAALWTCRGLMLLL